MRVGNGTSLSLFERASREKETKVKRRKYDNSREVNFSDAGNKENERKLERKKCG